MEKRTRPLRPESTMSIWDIQTTHRDLRVKEEVRSTKTGLLAFVYDLPHSALIAPIRLAGGVDSGKPVVPGWCQAPLNDRLIVQLVRLSLSRLDPLEPVLHNRPFLASIALCFLSNRRYPTPEGHDSTYVRLGLSPLRRTKTESCWNLESSTLRSCSRRRRVGPGSLGIGGWRLIGSVVPHRNPDWKQLPHLLDGPVDVLDMGLEIEEVMHWRSKELLVDQLICWHLLTGPHHSLNRQLEPAWALKPSYCHPPVGSVRVPLGRPILPWPLSPLLLPCVRGICRLSSP